MILKHAVSRLKSSNIGGGIDMDVPPKVNIEGHVPLAHRDRRHYNGAVQCSLLVLWKQLVSEVGT